jgi:hypothetical protein
MVRTNSNLFLITWRDQVGAQDLTMDDQRNERRATKIAKRNKTKRRDTLGGSKKSVCTSFLIRISKPSKVGKSWLSCGP